MARKKKSEFFDTSSNKLFKNTDKPDQQTFQDLVDSSTFPTELTDKAKLTEAGLAKITTDEKINNKNCTDEAGVSPSGFPTFVKPCQLPIPLGSDCIEVIRVNRTNGEVVPQYTIGIAVQSCTPGTGNSTISFQLSGIYFSDIHKFQLGVVGGPYFDYPFTDNAGYPVFTQTIAATILTEEIKIVTNLGYEYLFQFTANRTLPTDCVVTFTGLSTTNPPSAPAVDPSSTDGDYVDDFKIVLKKNCLPSDAKDIEWNPQDTLGSAQTIKKYDHANCPASSSVVSSTITNGSTLEAALIDVITKYNETVEEVKLLSDELCTVKASIPTLTESGLEIGDIAMTFTPSDRWDARFLEPLGQLVAVVDYPDLHTLIGTTYNTGGESADTFRLPNIDNNQFFRAKQSVAGAFLNPQVNNGGADSYQLTVANIPQHDHSIPALSGTTNSAGTHFHEIHTDIEGASSLAHDDPSGDEVAAPQADTGTTPGSADTQDAGAHTHTVSTTPSTTGQYGTASPTVVDTVPSHVQVYVKMRVK